MKLQRLFQARTLSLLPIGALLVLLSLYSCTPNPPVHNSRFLAFGTLMDISLIGVSTRQAAELVDILEQDFERMNYFWHAWNPGPVGYVNEKAGQPDTFVAPPSTLPLIRLGQRLAEQSEHLFNPAIGKLIKLWGFQSDMPEQMAPPAEEKIAALVEANPRMSDLHIDGIHLRSDNPAVQLDFGAFGKGYGIDLAIERLKQAGVKNAIVNAGGDLRAIGSRAGTPWRIAIRDPSGKGVLAIVEVAGDESVFTSGDYERNFSWKGKTYHHIIDPRTGHPAEGTHSVTVIHDNATEADAAATALFVAGPKDWHRIARRMGIKYVLLVDAEGRLQMNPAMRDRLQLLDDRAPIILSEPL